MTHSLLPCSQRCHPRSRTRCCRLSADCRRQLPPHCTVSQQSLRQSRNPVSTLVKGAGRSCLHKGFPARPFPCIGLHALPRSHWEHLPAQVGCGCCFGALPCPTVQPSTPKLELGLPDHCCNRRQNALHPKSPCRAVECTTWKWSAIDSQFRKSWKHQRSTLGPDTALPRDSCSAAGCNAARLPSPGPGQPAVTASLRCREFNRTSFRLSRLTMPPITPQRPAAYCSTLPPSTWHPAAPTKQ